MGALIMLPAHPQRLGLEIQPQTHLPHLLQTRLNLRLIPNKRLDRETPQPLEVPDAMDVTWSIDFTRQPRGMGAASAHATSLTTTTEKGCWQKSTSQSPQPR